MQKALEGGSKIVILATISQSPQCYDESVNTIKFAIRAKDIVQVVPQNKATECIDPIVKQAYENKILQLQRKIQLMERASMKGIIQTNKRNRGGNLNKTTYG